MTSLYSRHLGTKAPENLLKITETFFTYFIIFMKSQKKCHDLKTFIFVNVFFLGTTIFIPLKKTKHFPIFHIKDFSSPPFLIFATLVLYTEAFRFRARCYVDTGCFSRQTATVWTSTKYRRTML